MDATQFLAAYAPNSNGEKIRTVLNLDAGTARISPVGGTVVDGKENGKPTANTIVFDSNQEALQMAGIANDSALRTLAQRLFLSSN